VRELEHAVESATVLAPDGVIRLDRLPLARASVFPASAHEVAASRAAVAEIPLGLSLERASTAYIRALVASVGGNRSEAARVLGVSRNTVARALREDD